jgi:hypothetical protein
MSFDRIGVATRDGTSSNGSIQGRASPLIIANRPAARQRPKSAFFGRSAQAVLLDLAVQGALEIPRLSAARRRFPARTVQGLPDRGALDTVGLKPGTRARPRPGVPRAIPRSARFGNRPHPLLSTRRISRTSRWVATTRTAFALGFLAAPPNATGSNGEAPPGERSTRCVNERARNARPGVVPPTSPPDSSAP